MSVSRLSLEPYGTLDFSGPGIAACIKETKRGTTLQLGFECPSCDIDINSIYLGCTQRRLKHRYPDWSYVSTQPSSTVMFLLAEHI